MSKYAWNQRFQTWARPLSETEDQRCQNAESVILSALAANPELAAMDLRIFAQGSYRANTNVRADSDVDICVCNVGTVFTNYPEGANDSTLGYLSSSLTFAQYKDLIHRALHDRFTAAGYTRGDKAFNVHANSYRIHADVVPTLEYRDFYLQGGAYVYRSGVKFITDSGVSIVNWPDQTYANGTAKTHSTGRVFKQVVRILKGLRNEMQEFNIPAAAGISSFFLESLVWNIEDYYFNGDSLYDIVSAITLQIWFQTSEAPRCREWTEVNGIKYLFHSSQPWTREQGNAFLWAVRQYVGFS